MTIIQFGRPLCSACQEAHDTITSIYPPHFAFRYHTVTGDVLQDGPAALAEADYYDVFDILPVVIIEHGGEVLRRWEGEAPGVEEIHRQLSRIT